MKRVLILLGAAASLLLLLPFLVLVLVAGTSSYVAACQQWADSQPLAGTSSSQVTLTQANIKTGMPARAFAGDLQRAAAGSPDFITLNEVGHRSRAQLTPPGYDSFRGERTVWQRETPVLWRSDAWTLVESGTELMHQRASRLGTRYANWATVRSTTSGETVSVISVHPSPLGVPAGDQLQRQYLDRLDRLIQQLNSAGPVLIGGDLNMHHPRRAGFIADRLSGSGVRSTFEVLGEPAGGWATHRGGGVIDYVLSTPDAPPVSHTTADLPTSDHRMISATLELTTSVDLPAGASQPTAGLSTSQTKNAATVFAVGQQRGISERGIVIALATARQESGFKIYANDGTGDLAPDQRGIARSMGLPHEAVGRDHGSLGLFQQQWPWWSPSMEQLMEPAPSAGLFYDALLKVPRWESMEITQAAQAVQRSAYPDAYADDAAVAQQLYDHFAGSRTTSATTVATSGGAGGTGLGAVTSSGDFEALGLTAEEQEACAELVGMPTNLSCPPTGLAAEEGLTPDALLVLRCVDQQFGRHTYHGVGQRAANSASDHPSGRGVDVMIENWQNRSGISEGDQIGEWVRTHSTELGVTYVIWRAKIWSVDRADEGWRPYGHPSGAADPTSAHMDHVHVSVHGNQGTGFAAATGGSTVVYPVPATMADRNRDNWGRSGSNWARGHTGTDFSVPCGTPVLASHAGTVQIETDQGWSGPQLVKVSMGPGQLTTWYAHMQRVTVRAGATVAAGQQIGEVGSEGNSTGCHLHFEVHLKGGSIYGPDNTDPTAWLAQNVGRTLGGGATRVASLNVLGHSHTAPGGNKASWPNSGQRIRGASQRLNAAQVEIAGLQEFEKPQARAFLQLNSGRWDVYPRPSVRGHTSDAVAWRTDKWNLVRAERIAIPYFGGRPNPMPYVLLRSKATGQQVWVGSFHNPASTRGPAQQWRNQAVRKQADLANRLGATGIPVIFTGDMNDHARYYCDTVRASALRAAAGGTPNPCRAPNNAGIDWVMGDQRVQFSGYRNDTSLKGARIADHPLVSAGVTFAGGPPV